MYAKASPSIWHKRLANKNADTLERKQPTTKPYKEPVQTQREIAWKALLGDLVIAVFMKIAHQLSRSLTGAPTCAVHEVLAAALFVVGDPQM